jgi:hypothetical protein
MAKSIYTDINELQAVLTAAVARHEAQAAKVQRLNYVLSPYTDRDAAVDELERLDAEANFASAKADLARLAGVRREAERAFAAAREHVKAERRAELTKRLATEVKALKKALAATRPLNDMVQLTETELHEAGGVVEGWSWIQLARSEGTTFGSKFDDWAALVDERFGE